MRTGGIKPNEQLLKQLQQAMCQCQGGQCKLTKEQLEPSQRNCRTTRRLLAEALKNSPELKLRECLGKLPRSRARSPGRGGINRGPGTAPLSLRAGRDQSRHEEDRGAHFAARHERLAPGDVLGVSDGKHDVDKNGYKGPQKGGALQNTGDGGAAVWQNSLLPSEREALKRYFK